MLAALAKQILKRTGKRPDSLGRPPSGSVQSGGLLAVHVSCLNLGTLAALSAKHSWNESLDQTRGGFQCFLDPQSCSATAPSIRFWFPPPPQIYNNMLSSDAEDDHSRSASLDESGGEQEGGDMAEHPEDREDGAHQNGHKSASNAKDPLRPRRKKARRACFACQRAHLTCGRSG